MPSVLREVDLQSLTHIWISHEHPDHFHPESLRFIRSVADQEITLLFQETVDSRVVNWCLDEGFKVDLGSNETWISLNETFKIMIGKVGLYDSWAAFTAGGFTFLDLNDCVFPTSKHLNKVREVLGEINCLMAQFSYASWLGNPEETEFREREAKNRGDKLVELVQQLNPVTVIPAASFSWFSHEENSYLNDFRIDVGEAVKKIESAGSVAIVLMPGEEWDLGVEHENSTGIAFYDDAWDVSDRELHTAESVDFDVLELAALKFSRKLKKRNNRFLLELLKLPIIKLISPLKLNLTDLNEIVELHPLRGLKRTSINHSTEESVVSLHSSSLLYALKVDWGSDTLSVNGRFRADLDGAWRLNQTFWFAVLNNAGRYVRWRELLDGSFLEKAIRRIRVAVGVNRGSENAPL